MDKYISTKILSMHKKITYKILFISIVILGPKKHHIEAAVFGYSIDNTPGPKIT